MVTMEIYPGSNGAQLAELTFQTPQSLAAVTAALERQGLIERRTGHGRAFGHHLTDAGTKQLHETRTVLAEFHRRVFAGFDGRRLARFIADLDVLTSNLVEVERPPPPAT